MTHINNFHHIPSSCTVNGTYGKRSSAHAQSMRVHAICLNHRDELDRLTLGLDSRQKRQIDVSVTGLTRQYSTVQIGMVHSTRIACICMNACGVLYIALASFIYTRDYVSQKNA